VRVRFDSSLEEVLPVKVKHQLNYVCTDKALSQ